MEPQKNPVWIALWPTILLVGFGLACGGGGATFGENSPGNAAYGGGTYLDDAYVGSDTPEGVGENGSLAVDPDTEFVYTLQKRIVDDREEKRIVVIPPDGAPRELLDITGYVDARILFPANSVLVMAEPAWSEEAVESGACLQPEDLEREENRCGDELIWFDKSARRKLKQHRTRARYHGTRLSPKRNYLVVADNFYDNADIHLLDVETGQTNVVPQDGEWFEGMWMHSEDALLTAHFSRVDLSDASSKSFLTIREWFPGADQSRAALGQSLCFFTEGAAVPENCDSVAIADLDPMFFTGFSWIVISPDDRYVAVPAKYRDGRAVVVVVDRETRELRLVDDAYGPVGFTPDSKTMIAFGWDTPPDEPDYSLATLRGEKDFDGAGPHLQVVDLDTYEVTIEPTPGMDRPSFFVSHDSNDVVVVNFGGSRGMLIFDLDALESTRMASLEVATQGRRHYSPVELANADPTKSELTVDRHVVSASDLLEDRQIEPLGCQDAVCEADGFVTLSEFVSRTGHRELWLLEGRGLMRVDLDLGIAEQVEIDGSPEHINILPERDRLVIDSRGEQRVRFFDPATRRVESEESISLGWEAL